MGRGRAGYGANGAAGLVSIPRGENTLLKSRLQWLDNRIKMILFLIAGASAGVGHHLFYAALAGRSAEGGIFTTLRSKLHATLSDQSLVNLCANLFSKVGAQCLVALVGIAFAQLFWARLVRKAARIREVWRKLSHVLEYVRAIFVASDWRLGLQRTIWDMLEEEKVCV